MRIWNICAGYLARQQLLGEHRELQGLFNIISKGKCGYARHPETQRWANNLPALRQRHQELVTEMNLRGYRHNTPINLSLEEIHWPERYIDAPHLQVELLRGKYADGRCGRIPLPGNLQVQWVQHKYSVIARGPALYLKLAG